MVLNLKFILNSRYTISSHTHILYKKLLYKKLGLRWQKVKNTQAALTSLRKFFYIKNLKTTVSSKHNGPKLQDTPDTPNFCLENNVP